MQRDDDGERGDVRRLLARFTAWLQRPAQQLMTEQERAAYRAHQERLTASYAGQRDQLAELWAKLKALPDARRTAMANALRGAISSTVSPVDAHLLAEARKLRNGPYGQAIDSWATGVLSVPVGSSSKKVDLS